MPVGKMAGEKKIRDKEVGKPIEFYLQGLYETYL